MSKKSLSACKTWREVDHYVMNNPDVREIRQCGSHKIVKGPLPGSAVYPVHNGDAAPGTLRSFIKMMLLIGLGAIPLLCIAATILKGG
jgi:hypothetical protein